MDKDYVDIQLTLMQSHFLPAMQWLLTPDIFLGTGRSTLMAFVFLQFALTRRGEWITVFDHIPGPQAAQIMVQRITRMKPQDVRMEVRGDAIRVL